MLREYCIFNARTGELETVQIPEAMIAKGLKDFARQLREQGKYITAHKNGDGAEIAPNGSGDEPSDFLAVPAEGDSLWLNIGPISINLSVAGGEGVSVSLYAAGLKDRDSLASTWMTFAEASADITEVMTNE
ncbi:hypothetical protein A3709_20375 [Halioglobus sp. HI00S01]|uniref:hypothetical protein n=1 Tax=Halioglobus sp. HI00S01 TaxID=1822214 RepID=UPI0007C29C5A|nr:hypothetical protein [Halioglobus sp. HI00S01]KZX57970.1 hypothetical protein A3709_20375 [Halioglobus sp. HI00S01]